MERHDYAFPFRIDPTSRQAAQTPYETHVEQMIRQVLLTAPGERANLPEFGCGLRQLLFAPHSEAIDATTKLLILQALNKWLGNQIQVKEVKVTPPDLGMNETIYIQIDYVLIETQMNKQLQVLVF
jgi:phage baseplate assembly protein W